MSNERLTVDRLNDDGVVFLLIAIFNEDYYRSLTIGKNNADNSRDPIEFAFGGAIRVGNSYNGDYQLGIQMVHQYRKKITGL